MFLLDPLRRSTREEANGRAEKAVERVQDGVPARNQHVVVVNLSESLCGEDERIDNCLEEAGNLYMGHPLDERWHEEKHEHQYRDGHALPTLGHEASDERDENERPENRIEDEGAAIERNAVFKTTHD